MRVLRIQNRNFILTCTVFHFLYSFNHSWYKPELSEDFMTSELYERLKSLITDLSTEDKKMLKYILKGKQIN